MNQASGVGACPVCAATAAEEFLVLEDLPVFCNVLHASREAAEAAPRGDLKLAFCPDCGHVFNHAFDPARLDYDEAYENSLHHSPRFQEYAESLAAGLVRRHDLTDRTVLEIACGKGDFLRFLVRYGAGQAHGFDPSYDPATDPEPPDPRVNFVREYFGPEHAALAADLICCRHALEHFAAPTDFLSELRATLAERPATALFFEVPNGLFTFADLGIWDLIYEHPHYFNTASLFTAFSRAGFAVREVYPVFGEQFLGLEATAGGTAAGPPVLSPGLVAERIATFGERYRAKRDQWQQLLANLPADRPAVVWGGGSKGVTFLNVLPGAECIDHVVDIHPHRAGKFVPGGGQRIVVPDELVEIRPSAVVVMNPLYRDEIGGMLAARGVATKIVVA
jgi:SAM-dependent methyltransferase